MTVKDVRGRRRYVAFRVGPGTGKTILINKLQTQTDKVPYVIQSDGGFAILRCSPSETDVVIALMLSIDPSWTSILTSGTLKTLRDKIPELAVPKKSLK